MTHRFERVKDLYKFSMASELMNFAEDEDELKGLTEELLTTTEPPKPKSKTEKEEVFVPVEDIGEELGGGPAPEKKEPILTHREKDKPLQMFLPQEMETTKFTPGGVRGKVCDMCGRFNFPAWKKECSHCKRIYNYMRDLVDFNGITPAKAAKLIAEGKTRIPTTEELSGLITSPERLSTKKQHYLTEDQLKEIWIKGGKIELPERPENLDERFEDKKGLIGVPNRVKLQNALETQLNVQKVEKEVFDPKTGKVLKVKDVYYDPEGSPVLIAHKEKDFFSLTDISKKLKLDTTGILKAISEFNTAQGLSPNDPQAIKPARYYDELNQAFSWKRAVEPVFKDRIKEVYDMFKNTYLAKLSQRKEKLDSDVYNIELSLNMLKLNKDRIKGEIEKSKDRKSLAELFKLRQQSTELLQGIGKAKDDEEKRKNLTNNLARVDEQKSILEKKFGRTLDSYVKRMQDATDELMRVNKRLESMKQARTRVITKAKEYLTAVGGPGERPEEITPSDLQKVQTGQETADTGDIDLNELTSELMEEKKAYRINKLLKLADEEKLLPLPGQLDLPGVLEFDPSRTKERALKQIFRKPTEEEEEKKKIKVKNIMKGKLTREEAEDRLDASDDPLADVEGLTPDQIKLRNNKIHTLMLEHPTEEEARARIEGVEAKPVKLAPTFKEPQKETEIKFDERPCPFCGKNKIISGAERCTSCGFTSSTNRKDVIVEKTFFRLVYDKDGNPIPKLEADGSQALDHMGNPAFKKRPEKQYSLVSIQYDDFGQPKWATARKASAITPDSGAKTTEEKESFYKRLEGQNPKIRDIKPLTKNPEDFRPVFDYVTDEEGKESRVDTGQKEHKQKCRGCPEPGVKVPVSQFPQFPMIEEAFNFVTGKDMGNNIKAWMYQDVFQPKKEEIATPRSFEPTILPTGASRFEKILRLSMMS